MAEIGLKNSEKIENILNSLNLAYIGDAVYELMVRNRLIEKNPQLSSAKLHVLAIKKVSAGAQSKAYDYVKDQVTAKEYEIMRRGRNNKVGHYPKHSTPIEYHKATGLESLFGYLFLNKEYDKIKEYFDKIYYFLENF